MKKLLGIIVLGLLLSVNAYAEETKIRTFNHWLFKNGYHQYLDPEPSEKCKSFDKGDMNWYGNICY